ncbi:MAG: PDZ domain-containing protein [Planctomycetes bacterium]|nr:PDZ domain-containing protein [Planctomycetota bacterium]
MVKLFWILKITLVLLLVLSIVRFVLLRSEIHGLLGPKRTVGTEAITPPTKPSVETLSYDREALINSQLFHTREVVDVAQTIDTPSQPATSLDQALGITLVGTVTGSDALARAIIRDRQTKQINIFRVGDSLANAQVVEIRDRAVILLIQGQHRTLPLSVDPIPSTLQSKQIRQTTSPSWKPPAHRKIVDVDNRLPPSHTPLTYVQEILAKAQLEPHQEDGRIQGIKISQLEAVPVAKRFGLKEGDIIRSVNGQLLTGKQKAFQVFKKARSQATLTLELQRQGKIKELSFNLVHPQ